MSVRSQKQVTIKGLSPQRSITRVQRGLVRGPSPTLRRLNRSNNLNSNTTPNNLDSTIKEKFGSSTTLTSLDYGTLHYSGYLMKLGKNKCWQRRLFRLESGILTCYRTQRSQLLNHPPNGRISSPSASATSLTCVAFKVHVPKWQLPLEDVVDIRLLQNDGKDKSNSWFNLKMSRSFVITTTQGEHHILRCIGSMDLSRWLFTLTSQWPLYRYATNKLNRQQVPTGTGIRFNETLEACTSKERSKRDDRCGRRRSKTLDNLRPKPTFMLQEDSYKNAFAEAWHQTLPNLSSSSHILKRNDSDASNLETALLAKAHLSYMNPELDKFTSSDHAKLDRGESPIVPLNGVDPLDLLSLAIEAYGGNVDCNSAGKGDSPKIKLMESTQLKPNFQPPLDDVSRSVEIVGFKEGVKNNQANGKQGANSTGIKLKPKPLPFVEHSTKSNKPVVKTKAHPIKLTVTESTSTTTTQSSSSFESINVHNVSNRNLTNNLRVMRSETNLKNTLKSNPPNPNTFNSMSTANLNGLLKAPRRPSDPEKRSTARKEGQHPSTHKRNLSDNLQLSNRSLHLNGTPLVNKIDEKRNDQILRIKMNQLHIGTNHKSPYMVNSSPTSSRVAFNPATPNFHKHTMQGVLPYQHQRSKSLEDRPNPNNNTVYNGRIHSKNPNTNPNCTVTNQYGKFSNSQSNLNGSASVNSLYLQQKMALNNFNYYNGNGKPLKGTGGSSNHLNLHTNGGGGGHRNNAMLNAAMQTNFTP